MASAPMPALWASSRRLRRSSGLPRRRSSLRLKTPGKRRYQSWIAYASGSIAYAQEYARTLVEKGKTRLRRSFPDRSDSRELLLSMADFFIERIS